MKYKGKRHSKKSSVSEFREEQPSSKNKAPPQENRKNIITIERLTKGLK
jgi:hypothetical protein